MVSKTPKWLGIDFSGNHLQWKTGRRKSNVWVATVVGSKDLELLDLRKVQDLEGNGKPFERLVNLLRVGNFQAAGIDAPFSIPSRFVPEGNHKNLLETVDRIPFIGRPFPQGAQLVSSFTDGRPLQPPKPLRATETYWKVKKVMARSTMWNGPRPGAPMTVACLKLIAQASSPIWPWDSKKEGLLVEAFPAAQLKLWGCPFNRYNGNSPESEINRQEIFSRLANRVRIDNNFKNLILSSADALDSVICAFAAIAASQGPIASEPEWAAAKTEGWISVHC